MLTTISFTLAFCHLTESRVGSGMWVFKVFLCRGLISSFMELLRTLIAYKRLPLSSALLVSV